MATRKKKASEGAGKTAAAPRPNQDAYDSALNDFARAVELLRKGEFVAAKQSFDTIIDAVPDEAELVDRSRIYATICDRRLAAPPEKPQTSQDLYFLGVLQCNEGLLDEAVDTLTRALTMEPDSTRVLFARAAVRARQRRTDDAVADLRRAVDQDPKVRFQAVNDPDFDGIRDEAAFIDIVEPTPSGV